MKSIITNLEQVEDPESLRVAGHTKIAEGHALLARAEQLGATALKATAPDVVTKHDAARYGMTERAWEDAARAGKFPTRKAGRTLTAKRADFEAWLDSRARAPKVAKTDASGGDPYAEVVELSARRAGAR